MKYSYMSFSTPNATLREMLDIAREFGYQGIEPRIDANHRHGVEPSMTPKERKEARATVAGCGLAIACIATSLKFADPQQSRETFEKALRVIDLAADLNCPVVRVFGGGFPEDWTRDAAIGHCVEAFRRVAPHAAERKIKLAFETHDAWTDPSHVMAVIDKIDVGSVQVNWDVMHPVRSSGYTMEGAFEILNGSICHVHVHDGTTSNDNLEIRKMGSGEYDHQTAIGLLKESGYTGFISGEWIESAMPDDYGYREHLPHELAMLREYERKAGRDGRGTA